MTLSSAELPLVQQHLGLMTTVVMKTLQEEGAMIIVIVMKGWQE